ncbi:GntR family transcriptional regulator [Phyllobacterium sp. 21LDTY02-6]|nr:GntR family transcriptional regulator [Phyllobacterium sp. 21LDTY02-6]MCO4317878.1 GntR family transcriptional regulator [Phyllobacterium sp. 21LDTY02-6]
MAPNVDKPAKRGRPPKVLLSKREPLAQQAASTIRGMIIRGEMAPGSRIPERTLSETIKISRTPLREALKLLERDGLVQILQNRGARVMSFTVNEARELFEVIAGMESLAAQLAARRITPVELERLEELHGAMLIHHRNHDKDPYFAVNNQIHDLIVEFSGNSILRATHEGLMLRARRGRYMAIMKPSRWDESVAEHEALMQALRNRDASAARRIWQLHLNHTGDTVCSVLLEQLAETSG